MHWGGGGGGGGVQTTTQALMKPFTCAFEVVIL